MGITSVYAMLSPADGQMRRGNADGALGSTTGKRSHGSWIKKVDPVFAPGYLYLGKDPLTERLNTARAVIGFVVVALVAVYFQGFRGLGGMLNEFLGSAIFLDLAAFVSVLLAGAFLVAVTRSGHRAAAAWQLRWPVAPFAGLAVPLAFLHLNKKDTGGLPPALHVALILAAPGSVAILSLFELSRLHRNPRFPFRDGPPGQVQDAGSSWPPPDPAAGYRRAAATRRLPPLSRR